MTDDKTTKIESPVRVEVTADATASLEQATDTAASFVERVVMPPAEAVSRFAVDLVEWLRGPFQRMRIENLAKLGKRVRELQDEQGVTEPLPLPPKSANVVIEQGSFEEDDVLRELWAQLIVNAQAGMDISTYLFEVLSKLNAADVRLLRTAETNKGELWASAGNFSRLLAVGLMRDRYEVSVHGPPQSLNTGGELEHAGFGISELGREMLAAVTSPHSRE